MHTLGIQLTLTLSQVITSSLRNGDVPDDIMIALDSKSNKMMSCIVVYMLPVSHAILVQEF